MADISKITLPDGNTYDIVDKKSGFSKVSVSRKTTSGINIADITIDGTTTQLYAPQGGGSGTITGVKTTAGAHSAINVTSGAANFNVPTKTSHLTNDSGFTTNTGTITGVTAGTGLSGGGTSGSVTLNHSNSIAAGTASSTTGHTDGVTVTIPYVKYNSTGHITEWGERTHTVTGFLTKDDILSTFYPVGSYYETSDTTFNPNTAWGGTWVLESAGKFHVSAGTGYTAGSTGGSADAIVPYHRHSVAKVTGAITGGEHAHDIANRSVYSGGSNYLALFKGGTGTSTNAALSETHTHDLPAHNTDYAGTSGNTTGANMPPYIAVNRWHRTA